MTTIELNSIQCRDRQIYPNDEASLGNNGNKSEPMSRNGQNPEPPNNDANVVPESEGEAVVKLNRKQLAIMSVAMALAVFLIALDETIIATAIPRITDEFHSLNDVGWYGSGYMLTLCSFQLQYGKLYQRFPPKRVMLVAITLFEIGSLLCGAAPNSAALIVGRVIAGSGASGILIGTIIIIANAVPLRERPIYTGAVGSIYGVASVAGPLLGGFITDSRLTWRWCFYINPPIGAFVAFVFLLLYSDPNGQQQDHSTLVQKIKSLDPLGFFLFVPAVVCLLLALQLGGGQYAWNSARVVALLTLAGLFLIAFITVQLWLQDEGTLPPRVVGQRTVAFASLFAMCLDGAYYVLAYYLPIWFQVVQGVSAAESGIHIVPLIVGAFATSIVAGAMVTYSGYYNPFIIAATIFTSIGCGLLTTLEVGAGPSQWIGFQILVGIGCGCGMQLAMVAVQNSLNTNDIPVGIAVVGFLQTLGPAIMVSVAQNVLDQRLVARLRPEVPGLNATTILDSGVTSIVSMVEPNLVPTVLISVSGALSQTWYAAVAVAVISGVGALGMEWKSVKKAEESRGESRASGP